MELLGSPLITMILNIIASGLVAHGILSETVRDTFVQMVNNALAAGVTFFVALYSIYKMVDLHKHKITVTSTSGTITQVSPVSTVPPVEVPVVTVKPETIAAPVATPVVLPAVQQIAQNGLTGVTQPVNG